MVMLVELTSHGAILRFGIYVCVHTIMVALIE